LPRGWAVARALLAAARASRESPKTSCPKPATRVPQALDKRAQQARVPHTWVQPARVQHAWASQRTEGLAQVQRRLALAPNTPAPRAQAPEALGSQQLAAHTPVRKELSLRLGLAQRRQA